jgi:hypothetical protein
VNIEIKGRYFSKTDRSLLSDFAEWSGQKLIGKRITRYISLTIQLNHPNHYKKHYLYADTDYNDEDCRKLPRNFIVTMTSRFGMLRSLVILAHEMVHVKQFALGELVWHEHNKYPKWLGRHINYEHMSYWDLPYEVEAHGREKGLVYQWCDERKLWKEYWYRELF